MLSNGLSRVLCQFRMLLNCSCYWALKPYEGEPNTPILWMGKWSAQGHQLAGMELRSPGWPALSPGHIHSARGLSSSLAHPGPWGAPQLNRQDEATPDLPSQDHRRNGFPWRCGANLG